METFIKVWDSVIKQRGNKTNGSLKNNNLRAYDLEAFHITSQPPEEEPAPQPSIHTMQQIRLLLQDFWLF